MDLRTEDLVRTALATADDVATHLDGIARVALGMDTDLGRVADSLERVADELALLRQLAEHRWLDDEHRDRLRRAREGS